MHESYGSEYVASVREMGEELDAHPEIELETFEIRDPATADQLARAKEYYGLAPGMEDFYLAANGFQIQWSYIGDRFQDLQPSAGTVRGRIDVRGVEKTFRDHEGVIYFDHDDRFEDLHPLDFFVPEACAALSLDGSDNPDVYYHYCGEEAESMELDFRQYLDLLLQSRGFWYWQKTIAPPEYFNEYQPISSEEATFRLVMPELFDDFDDADFERRDGHEPTVDDFEKVVGEPDESIDLSNYGYIRDLVGLPPEEGTPPGEAGEDQGLPIVPIAIAVGALLLVSSIGCCSVMAFVG